MDGNIIVGMLWVMPTPEGYVITDLGTHETIARRLTLREAMRRVAQLDPEAMRDAA